MPNIEIKARYSDLEKARRIAGELSQSFNVQCLGRIRQVDTYYQTRAGRLKLRESDRNGAELIPYVRADQRDAKRSDYIRLPCDNPELLKGLLSQILGTKQVVDKVREVYLIGNVRVHLDQVTGLGNFFEFEAVFNEDTAEVRERERRKLQDLMSRFEILEADLVEGSYSDLLYGLGPM